MVIEGSGGYLPGGSPHLLAEDCGGLYSTVLVDVDSEVSTVSVSHQLLPLQHTYIT